jgi:transposase InsO family protein
MWGKRFTAVKIINMLREAEVLLSTGKSTGEVCRELNISEQTYYRWRKEYGGMYIEPGSPWGNGYIESFNGKMRDEVLSREVFDALGEAEVLVEHWRREYNHISPHSSLGYGLLPRRTLYRWECRYSVPLRSTSHLRVRD